MTGVYPELTGMRQRIECITESEKEELINFSMNQISVQTLAMYLSTVDTYYSMFTDGYKFSFGKKRAPTIVDFYKN